MATAMVIAMATAIASYGFATAIGLISLAIIATATASTAMAYCL
jgi:hypothetical protein